MGVAQVGLGHELEGEGSSPFPEKLFTLDVTKLGHSCNKKDIKESLVMSKTFSSEFPDAYSDNFDSVSDSFIDIKVGFEICPSNYFFRP